MQVHTTKNTLCLVGKGWQIKAYLRQFRDSHALVADFLSLPSSRSENANGLQPAEYRSQTAYLPARSASWIQ